MCAVLADIVEPSDLTVGVAQDYNALAADVANHIAPGCFELGDVADILPVSVKNPLELIDINRFIIIIVSWQGPGITRIVAKVCEVLIRCRHDQASGLGSLIGWEVSFGILDCATNFVKLASDISDERPE